MASFIGLFWWEQLRETSSLKICEFLFKNFWKHLFFFFLMPLVLGEKKWLPLFPFLKKYSTTHTSPGGCLIYSASSIPLLRKFYILYFYWTTGPLWKICVLAIKPFCKPVTQILMIRWVSRMQEYLKDHLPHLCLRCSMAVYTKCHLAL